MKLHQLKLVSRRKRDEEERPAGDASVRRRWATRARLATVAVTLAAAGAATAIVAPAPASAATNYYEIANAGSNLRVDVMWGSTAPYQGAFLWPDNTSASQEFTLLDSGNGFYRIQARHSGQCLMLDWRGGSYLNGTKVIQYPYCSANYAPAEWSTQWVWRPNYCTGQCFSTGNWYALIKNRATGKCLDADNGAGGVPRQQAVLQQWDCISSTTQWNAWNQMWNFTTATSQLPPGPH